MPPHHNNPRLRILSVGGNAISAFLSWRLSATNACDVTLVWKSGFENVAQYGVSFRSSKFGNERFKPRLVVRSPEEAAHTQKGSFDYVLLCVKALPDVYDLAAVIEPVVTPQHTCILINTSHSLGVEALIEERFPQNVVLSLVSSAEIQQLGPAEFEHQGPAELWVGPANQNPEIPVSIQGDMAAALAMTLSTGQVDCHASKNIQQQQFERMIGPVAFHTTSVLFETPNHAELLELTGVRELISDTIEEMLKLAETRGCIFDQFFKERIMEEMIVSKEANSIMYQDYSSRRPMEVETYLGSPVKIARASGVRVPRIETLYAMLHHINSINQKRPMQPPALPAAVNGAQNSQMVPPPGPRAPSMNGHMPNGPMMNGSGPLPIRPGPGPGRSSRAPSMNGGPPPPGMRRGPPPGMNGYNPNGLSPHGMPQRGPPPNMQRRPSPDGNGLDEFSHVVMYDQQGEDYEGGSTVGYGGPSPDIALRERELMLRQKEIALREREMNMRGSMGPPMGRPMGGQMPPRARPPPSHMGDFDEEDGEDGDYFDPMAHRGPPVNPDNVDMMSITSRRNRKQPSRGELRKNPENESSSNRRSGPFGKIGLGRNRASSQMTAMNTQGLHEPIADNPLLGYSSDRYGVADRSNIAREGRDSRAGSLTTARLNELSQGPGYSAGYPPANRRTSHSPGHPLSPGGPMNGGPSPPGNGYGPHGGVPNGRPSPPHVRQPMPRHPPGHGNNVAPQQVENRAGVSNLYPPSKSGPPQVRSLTGSASASAGSGDSGRSAQVSAETSAYSSQSSIGPRPQIGVR